jgi:hypothetical protein
LHRVLEVLDDTPQLTGLYLVDAGKTPMDVYEPDGTPSIFHVTKEQRLLRMTFVQPSCFVPDVQDGLLR